MSWIRLTNQKTYLKHAHPVSILCDSTANKIVQVTVGRRYFLNHQLEKPPVHPFQIPSGILQQYIAIPRAVNNPIIRLSESALFCIKLRFALLIFLATPLYAATDPLRTEQNSMRSGFETFTFSSPSSQEHTLARTERMVSSIPATQNLLTAHPTNHLGPSHLVHDLSSQTRTQLFWSTLAKPISVIRRSQSSYLWGGFMVFALVYIGIIWMYVAKLTRSKLAAELEIRERRRVERAYRETEGVLRTLHTITSDNSLDFTHKLRAVLTMGCNKFKLPNGILARISQDGMYEIVECISPDQHISTESVFSIEDTYCCETLKSSEPIEIQHATNSEWKTHPAYNYCKLEAYIGIRILVDGKIYGTLNFMSPDPRHTCFSAVDKEIIKLMAQWVANELYRNLTEDRLKENQQRLRTIFESEPEWVKLLNMEGLVLETNPAGLTMIEADELLQIQYQSIYDIISPDHRAVFRELVESVFLGNSRVLEFDIITLKGRYACLEIHATPLRDSSNRIVALLGITRDITSHKQAEKQARQHQADLAHVSRLCTMGEMSSCLAHELNQPLTAIANYTRGCIHRLRNGNANTEDLIMVMQRATAQAERAAEIIRRLRAFVRKGESKRVLTDINSIVLDGANLAKIEARDFGIFIHIILDKNLKPVLADGIQIEQVLLNLIRNGIEATLASELPERELLVSTIMNTSGEAEIIVQDNGPGIAEQSKQRLFDPFYTTKPKGMGLGLSISRSIIEAHGGRLWVSHGEGSGATFHFTLPFAKGDVHVGA